MSTSSCFAHDGAALSNGLEFAYPGSPLHSATVGEMAFGIHKEKGHFGIIICDTQN